jgi:penicillin-binding protein 1A
LRRALLGVRVAALPNAQRGVLMSNLFKTWQVSAPAPSAPVPANAYRPAPARSSAPPPNPNARPEAAAGLDGWLMDRLFR